MKKKSLIFSAVMVLSSIISIQNASAEEGIYGVIGAGGTVDNIIVCSPMVCGGGNFAGMTTVLQVAPNPATGDVTGRGGWMNDPARGITVTESNGIFNLDNNGFRESWTSPQKQSDGSYTVLKTGICGNAKEEMTDTTCAFTEAVNESRNNTITTQRLDFKERLSSGEVKSTVLASGLGMLVSRVNTVIDMLSYWGWTK